MLALGREWLRRFFFLPSLCAFSLLALVLSPLSLCFLKADSLAVATLQREARRYVPGVGGARDHGAFVGREVARVSRVLKTRVGSDGLVRYVRRFRCGPYN